MIDFEEQDRSARYFMTEHGEPEREVTMEEWVAVERRCGFVNTMGRPDLPGTAGFSQTSGERTTSGRIEWRDEKEGD